jgi:hypothetical protein
MLKLFVVLFSSTLFIFSFSNFGAKAYETIVKTDGKFSAGTTIGEVDVSGKTEEEARTLLEEKYVDWLKNSSFQLQYGEKSAAFDLNQFHLDTAQTVNSLKDGQKNIAYITVDKGQVEEQVQLLFPQIKTSEIDLDKLMNSLTSKASLFIAGSNSYDLNRYLLTNNLPKEIVLNEATVEMADVPVDLQSLIEKVNKIELKENTTFSLLDYAKKQKVADSDSLNIIATGIYQAILPTNFAIKERNIGTTLPDYAKLGYESKVSQTGSMDLIFFNPNKTTYILELQLDHNKLIATLKGQKFVYDYKVRLQDEQELKAKTIVQYSPLLLPGKTKIQTKGAAGKVVKVYRDVYQGSSLIKREFISEDYYPSVYQVEIHGLAGSQAAATTTSGPTTSTQTTDSSSVNTNQTTSLSEQQDSTDSDIWGKPNEQSK